MPVILVAEQDAGNAQRIHDVLLSSGFQAEIVSSLAEAVSRAEKQPPSLLIASSELPEAKELLAIFSRLHNGPGAAVLLPAGLVASASDYCADEALTEPVSKDDLSQLVKRFQRPTPKQAAKSPEPVPDAEQLTSADIFGDVLAEVEAEAMTTEPESKESKRSASMRDIERKLEETLSGVIPTTFGKAKRSSIRQSERQDEAAIDNLLDKTLSSLDISTRPRKPTQAHAEIEESNQDPLREPTVVRSVDEASDLEGEPSSPLPKDSQSFEPPSFEPLSFEPPSFTEAVTAEAFERIETTADSLAFEATPDPQPLTSFSPPPATTPSLVDVPLGGPGSTSTPDSQRSPDDQFRTRILPTFTLGKEKPVGEDFGDYALLDRIAIGGMAEVWRARRRGVEGFQKTVAIKKILSHLTGSPDFVTMFIDEAKLAAQLSHNNIIQIYDLGKVANDFFIAMEYVEGKDLRSILTAAEESNRPLPLGLGLFVVSAVARALDYAHRQRDFEDRPLGLVHRDVSPQNVLLSYEGEIKLCDFGIVKAVAKASTTQMGALKGKLQYMSPEQAWGKTVDARSDIFSLGSVLFEVLTGTKLFSGDSEIGVLDAVRECKIPALRSLLPELPEEIDHIVLKALAKSPEDRFQTAGELEHEIKTVLDNLKPTPSQKDLAAYLHAVFKPDAKTTNSGSPVSVPSEAESDGNGLPAGNEAAIAAVPSTQAPVGRESTSTTALAESAEPLPEPLAAEQPAIEGSVEEAKVAAATAPDPTKEPASSRGQGRALKWLVAALLIASLIGVGFFVLLSQKKQAPPPEATPSTAGVQEAPAQPNEPIAAGDTTPTDGSQVARPDSIPADGTQPGSTQPSSTQPGSALPAATPRTAQASLLEESGSQITKVESQEAESSEKAAGPDIEQLVNEELTNRAERLRKDFEAEKKRIEQELAKTQAAEEAAVEEAGDLKKEGGDATEEGGDATEEGGDATEEGDDATEEGGSSTEETAEEDAGNGEATATRNGNDGRV